MADPTQVVPSGGKQLAIAAPSFGNISETFIHDHVRKLLPGRTVLISLYDLGLGSFLLPSLVLESAPTEAESGNPVQRVVRRVKRKFGHYLSQADSAQLSYFLLQNNVGWILAEFGPMGLFLQSTCNRLHIPLYVYFRGFDASQLLKSPTTVRRYQKVFRGAEGFFSVSEHLRANLIAAGCPADRITVNASGADPNLFVPGSPEQGRILSVGRLVDKKAPQLTIAAFAQIAARFPEARLDIVGEGPLLPLCKAVIKRYGLAHRVQLHGGLPHVEIVGLLAKAAVFVQHSVTAADGNSEGLPTAIVEAMLTALPVVATQHGGIPEAVADGETGLLVAEGDVDGMAAALVALLSDPARAQAMGRAGRERALARFTQTASHATIRRVIGLPEPDVAAVHPERGLGGPDPS